MSEAVNTMPSFVTMTSIVSKASLTRDTHTDRLTRDTHADRLTRDTHADRDIYAQADFGLVYLNFLSPRRKIRRNAPDNR